ncbi:hypothetical protein MMC25_005323 [Agyrium rufum]|nr:hypothetical protein [Agyrium rufum]
MAPAIVTQHHHRSTTKSDQKPFKSRHATKSFKKEQSKGKVEDLRTRLRTPLHKQVMLKFERRHQARQKRQNHVQQIRKATNVFAGLNGAPRIVAVVPLTGDCDASEAILKLNEGVEQEVSSADGVLTRVRVERFKQNVEYIAANRDMITVLDACQAADYIVFVLSPTQEVDEYGETLLRAIENQGMSQALTVVQDLDQIEPLKKRTQVTASLKSYISHFLPDQAKVHSLDSTQDCAGVVRILCATTPKGVNWREDRSWMLVEDVEWPSTESATDTIVENEVVLTGVVRGRNLKANRLVQVGDWGAFQIEKITAAPVRNSKKRKADEMATDEATDLTTLEQPDEDQDDLLNLAPEEIMMEDEDIALSEAPTERKGVLLDDHHYFEDDETHIPPIPTRLPRGTSSYQAAWFLGDVSDSGSDIDDDLGQYGDYPSNTNMQPLYGLESTSEAIQIEPTEMDASEYPQSEMFLDPSPNDELENIAAYRSQRKTEAAEDREFPDEIELEPNVVARERLQRYRGLKSLRTSHWETSEDKSHEPEEWNRLLQIKNYKGSKNQALNETLVGGVAPGTRVRIHLRNVPISLKSSLTPQTQALTLFSLLRHEHKQTAMNYSITLPSDYPAPIKSKTEIIVQCGPRRFAISPLFSQIATTPNNVHKFDRYLHPGTTAMATAITPLTWGSVPVLFFTRDPASLTQLTFLATGTTQPPDPSRVIAKRAILTGHPYKIHKKLVTVRYMFFNAEDVRWFKALQLWTKRGRSGYIKESLGTHGYFKATFDAKIDPQDAVAVSLYKRVWPRRGRDWRQDEETATIGDEELEEVHMEE